MTKLELALKVVDLINDRMAAPDGAFVEVVATDHFTGIRCGDLSLWDDCEHHLRCDICDRESYEEHTCPGDTVEGVLAYVEQELYCHAQDLLRLAGAVAAPARGEESEP